MGFFNRLPGVHGRSRRRGRRTLQLEPLERRILLSGPNTIEGVSLASDCPGGGEIHGSKWHDLNGDGVWDGGEPAVEGWRIYLDQNGNGRLDVDEVSTTTDAGGGYSFTDLPPDTYIVAEELGVGWEQTFPLIGWQGPEFQVNTRAADSQRRHSAVWSVGRRPGR
ncbi:MAG: hypothetical protein KAX44_03980 [Candidatus Brocadiae bacterium]|nr:hypothetical protein [Candidatus Brocadiia bacterium]